MPNLLHKSRQKHIEHLADEIHADARLSPAKRNKKLYELEKYVHKVNDYIDEPKLHHKHHANLAGAYNYVEHIKILQDQNKELEKEFKKLSALASRLEKENEKLKRLVR